MAYQRTARKFDRKTDQRRAFIRSLVRSLIIHEKISTTEARAKSIRPVVEKLITKGKSGTLSSRRLVASRIGDESAAKKVCEELAQRYEKREGGYTRIVKMAPRQGDAADLAVIELLK